VTGLEQTFAALADPTRRRVVEALQRGARRAGELAETTHMSAPALSRHLRVLREHGLVAEERIDDDARVRVYRLRRERFDELQEWLTRFETFWTLQLDSFKAHAERKSRSKRA